MFYKNVVFRNIVIFTVIAIFNLLLKRGVTLIIKIKFFFLYNFFFSFYHSKIHPATNYNAIKNKINKTR